MSQKKLEKQWPSPACRYCCFVKILGCFSLDIMWYCHKSIGCHNHRATDDVQKRINCDSEVKLILKTEMAWPPFTTRGKQSTGNKHCVLGCGCEGDRGCWLGLPTQIHSMILVGYISISSYNQRRKALFIFYIYHCWLSRMGIISEGVGVLCDRRGQKLLEL